MRVARLLLLLALVLLACVASGDSLVTQNPDKVKAAFLRNFARYVIWPGTAFPDGSAPWRVGILGPDPFGAVLEATFKERMEQGRAFEIFRANNLEELPPCQIIFIAYKDAAKRRAVLSELKGKPVLTVGDVPGFLQEGGIILFQVNEHVTMSVNLDQAQSASLTIPSKMLEVSSIILENGVVRSRR